MKYFTQDLHDKLEPVFRAELEKYGHIYMFNYIPRVHLEALPISMIPGRCVDGRAMMHMIMNNLDVKVA